MFHHYIYQTPAMYQMCHHHLSDTHNLSDLTSLFIRHMLHFARSIPITIYTLSARAPTHRYIHAFLCLFTHCTHHLRVAQIVFDIQQHRCGWQLAPNFGNKSLAHRHKNRKVQTLSAVSCQPSAVSCRSFFTFVRKGSRLWGVSSAHKTPIFAYFC